MSYLGVPLRETKLLDLFTTQEGGPVWGLRSVLRVVNAAFVDRYRWISETITPTYDELYQREGYSVSIKSTLK